MMSHDEIKKMLDNSIMFWREREHSLAQSSFAKYYVDAYQSVRKNIFGETLP